MVCDWYRVRCPHVTLSSHNAEEVIRFVWACASLTLSRRMLSLRQATIGKKRQTTPGHIDAGQLCTPHSDDSATWHTVALSAATWLITDATSAT
jgi:hypothetical protein